MNAPQITSPHVIIVGAGFGGVSTARTLLDQGFIGTITLISREPFFSYYPGLHSMLSSTTHHHVQIPLGDIFSRDNIHTIIDTVTHIDMMTKTVTLESGTVCQGDFLVIALGSETEYFNINGLSELAFGLKSYQEANILRNHIIGLFEQYSAESKNDDTAEKLVGLHFTIVGGGPSGVDLAGELAVWTKKLATLFHINSSLVTIDIIDTNSRLLSMLPESVSTHVESHLRSLGVNIFTNRNLIRESGWTLYLDDMKIGTKTLIWTAGVRASSLLSTIPGISLGKKGRVIVDEYLQPVINSEYTEQVGTVKPTGVYVIGDGADTPFSGLAQTAIYDAHYASRSIQRTIDKRLVELYKPKSVAYNIGAGPHWSLFVWGPIRIYGLIAHWLRSVIDIAFFLSILQPSKVWKLYMHKK